MENTIFVDYQNLINSFDALKKDASNPFYKSDYVTLNQVLKVVKQKCTEHNFIFVQTLGIVENNQPVLKTRLIHKSGTEFESKITIVSKDKEDPQKVGAGITYMRRYSLVTMFGLEDKDDDGNKASMAKSQPYKMQTDIADNPIFQSMIDNEPKYVEPADKCPKCGADMKISQAGKPYCSKLCWKK